MTRLIDADALEVDMVIEEAETPLMPWYPSHMPMRKTAGVSIEQINNAPTIDAVPVVRCKDCKCWTEWSNGTGSCSRCALDWLGTDADDFCSMGERKDDE